jgi:tetratricopeptide (TPR) repeat protein
LAQFYREHQKYQKVVPVYIEVLALLQQAQQKHPEVKTDETFVEYLVDDMADLGDAYGKLPKPDYAEAEKYYAQALALEKVRPSLSAAEKDEAYDIQFRLAEVLNKQKKYDGALNNYDEVIKYYSDPKSNIRKLALSLAAEGRIYLEMEAPEKAMKAFRDAVAAVEDNGDTEIKNRLADILVTQIKADHAKGAQLKPEEAGRYFARAENLTKLAVSISPRTMTSTYQSLVSSLEAIHQRIFRLGDVTGVAGLYEQVLDLKAKAATRGDYGADYLIQELEKMYREAGARQNEKLIELYRRALDIKARSEYGADNPSTYGTYNNLGQLYQDSGKYEEAAESYQKALGIVERVFTKDDASYVVDSLIRLGSAYRLQTNYAAAEKVFMRAKSNLEKHGRSDTSKMADLLDRYAEVLEVSHRLPEAAKIREESLRIRNKNGMKAKS